MGGEPIVYELSDSDGAPDPPPNFIHPPSRRTGRVASWRGNAEVVDLGSDSDEDLYRGPDLNKVEKPRESLVLPRQHCVLEKKRSLELNYGGSLGSALDSPDAAPKLSDRRMSVIAINRRLCPDGAAEQSQEFDSGQAKLGLKSIDAGYLESRPSFSVSRAFEDVTEDDSDPEWLRYDKPALSGGCHKSADSATEVDITRITENHWQFVPAFRALKEPNEEGDGSGETRKFFSVESRDSLASSEDQVFGVSVRHGLEAGEKPLSKTAKRKHIRIDPPSEIPSRISNDAGNMGHIDFIDMKSSKGRKVPMSEEDRQAREEEKQRERDLKKARQDEEKRLRDEKKEELRRQKEAAKVEMAEKKKLEKECEKWRKGKFALQNTTAHLDTKIVEMKNFGPLILGQLGGKDYSFKIVSNPIERTIVWKMKQPLADSQTDTEGLGSQSDSVFNSQFTNSQLVLEDVEIKYVVVVFQGEDFASMVAERKFHSHVVEVQKQYPGYAVCYLINGLMKFMKKEEQHHYKICDVGWNRPKVEEALADLITRYNRVQSCLCLDESQIADYIVGLMRSLATIPFKQKITSLSVHANGDHVTKSDPNKEVIKKCTWLKVLVAIPHIPGAVAIAVAKEYPTMRALLKAYLDPNRAVFQKEHLLENIVKEASLGALRTEGRRVGPVASKRIYRVLMAQDGNLMTEDAEDGADLFTGS